MLRGCVVVAIALLGAGSPSGAAAQAGQDIEGLWLARGSQRANGSSGIMTLELRPRGDSVVGTLQWEGTGRNNPPMPLRGTFQSDSLLLVNNQGAAMFLLEMKDRRLVGHMAQSPFGRGPSDPKALKSSSRIRFERQ